MQNPEENAYFKSQYSNTISCETYINGEESETSVRAIIQIYVLPSKHFGHIMKWSLLPAIREMKLETMFFFWKSQTENTLQTVTC